MSWSHPTPRGHTLRGVPRQGLAVAFRPSTPEKTKSPETPRQDIRTVWIKLRATPMEKDAFTAKAEAQGQTVTGFLQRCAQDYRLRQTTLEKERTRQLACIGANLNQIVRWVNIHKIRVEARYVA